MKTLARRAAAVAVTVGLCLGVTSVASATQANDDDTGWGRFAEAPSVVHD